MKKTILFCIALVACLPLAAQVRVVGRSASKVPAWIGVTQADYVIVSAEDATLDGAKQRCLTDIKQAVVNAVAMNITSEETSSEEQDRYNSATSIYGNYRSEVRTVAGQLPFITGIDLSKAETYWEKCYVRKEKRYYYICHVKYPFSRLERNRLIAEFLARDREQYDKYLELKAAFSTFTHVEDIDLAVNELDRLVDYFFDDVRRNEASTLRQNYRELYKHIVAVPYADELGDHTFALRLDGRSMTTSRAPKIRAGCATDVRVVPGDDGLYRVTYDYGNCLEDDDKTIQITYLLGGQAVRYALSFDVRQEKTVVIPYGEIELDVWPSDEERVVSIEGWLPLRSRFEGAFDVCTINFTVGGVNLRVEGEGTRVFEGKGSHRMNFTTLAAEGDFDKEYTLASGYIDVKNKANGQRRQVNFTLPCKIHRR